MRIIVTPEIYLSAIKTADEADLTAHLQDPDISRHMLLLPYPYTTELARRWIAQAASDVQRNGRQTIWAIRDASRRMIGEIELHKGLPASEHVSDIGYWLAIPCWNRGIMTAVVKSMVEVAFRDFGVQRITAPIFAENTASARVLEKKTALSSRPLACAAPTSATATSPMHDSTHSCVIDLPFHSSRSPRV